MIEAAGLTHQGSVRKNNEDYFLILADIGLYLVADGMGGAQAGEHASRLASETVAEFVRKAEHRDAPTLLDAFAEANRVVRAAADQPGFEGMGTTLVAALDTADALIIASVGDSRAYLLEAGEIRLVTADQTWVHEVGRPLGIEEEDLRNHPMRHVLTMAIGATAPLRSHQYRLQPTPGAQILLSSDGLHGVVSEETIAKALNSEQSLSAKCHYLIEAAIREGGPDNITVVLLRVV